MEYQYLSSPAKHFFFHPRKYFLSLSGSGVCGSEYYVHLWALQTLISITGRCNISCVIVALMSATLCAHTPLCRRGAHRQFTQQQRQKMTLLMHVEITMITPLRQPANTECGRVYVCLGVRTCVHSVRGGGVMLQGHT